MPTADDIRQLETRLARGPGPQAYAALGEAYRRAGRLDEALAVCRQGLERHPTYATARFILAKALLDRDEVVAALGELGIVPEVRSLGPVPVLPLGPREEAIDLLRFRLVVGPGTPGDGRLLAVLDDLTEERDGQLYPSGAPAHEAFLLRWTPALART